MKKFSLVTIFTLLVVFLLGLRAPQVAADSDVKLIMDGNTYYLSTQASTSAQDNKAYKLVEVSSATTSATISATTSSRTPTIFRTNVPAGYSESIGDLISFLLRVVMVVALLLVLLAFITAGIEWITSGGDKGKTESARNRIVAAFIGVLVLSGAYALVLLVAYILGFDSLEDVFSSIQRIGV